MTTSVRMAPDVSGGLILLLWATTWLDRLVTPPASAPQGRLTHASH